MGRIITAIGIIASLSVVLVQASAAFASPINPGQWIREYQNNTHFDFWARCKDLKIEPERRIGYCKSMLGGGHGNDVDALNQIGIAYIEENKYDAAIATLKSALGNYSNSHAQTRAKLDEALTLNGQYTEALADADEDIKVSPDAASLNRRCWLRAIAGKELTDALADCNRALKEKPSEANFLDSRGLVEFKLGLLRDAAADYDSALSRDPKLETSLYMRGVIELLNGDLEKANSDLDSAKYQEPLIGERFAAYGVRPQQQPSVR